MRGWAGVLAQPAQLPLGNSSILLVQFLPAPFPTQLPANVPEKAEQDGQSAQAPVPLLETHIKLLVPGFPLAQLLLLLPSGSKPAGSWEVSFSYPQTYRKLPSVDLDLAQARVLGIELRPHLRVSRAQGLSHLGSDTAGSWNGSQSETLNPHPPPGKTAPQNHSKVWWDLLHLASCAAGQNPVFQEGGLEWRDDGWLVRWCSR